MNVITPVVVVAACGGLALGAFLSSRMDAHDTPYSNQTSPVEEDTPDPVMLNTANNDHTGTRLNAAGTKTLLETRSEAKPYTYNKPKGISKPNKSVYAALVQQNKRSRQNNIVNSASLNKTRNNITNYQDFRDLCDLLTRKTKTPTFNRNSTNSLLSLSQYATFAARQITQEEPYDVRTADRILKC